MARDSLSVDSSPVSRTCTWRGRMWLLCTTLCFHFTFITLKQARRKQNTQLYRKRLSAVKLRNLSAMRIYNVCLSIDIWLAFARQGIGLLRMSLSRIHSTGPQRRAQKAHCIGLRGSSVQQFSIGHACSCHSSMPFVRSVPIRAEVLPG